MLHNLINYQHTVTKYCWRQERIQFQYSTTGFIQVFYNTTQSVVTIM